MIARPALGLHLRHDDGSLPNLPSLQSPTRKSRLHNLESSTIAQASTTQYWIKTVGIHLDGLMEDAFYTLSARQQFSFLFQIHIAPFMGEPPHRQRLLNRHQIWPSFMTDDHTPIEYGLAWKGRARANNTTIAPPQVRFSIEAIDTLEVLRYGTNRSASLRIVSSLASAGILDPSLFHTLFETICIQGHKDTINHRGSEVFLGFDITPSGSISVKAYFVLKDTQNDELLVKCLSRLDQIMNYSKSWTNRCGYNSIIQQLSYIDENKRGRPVLLAVDLVKPQDSRCKLYWRYPHVTEASQAAFYLHLNHKTASKWQDSLEKVLGRFNNEANLPSSSEHPTGGLLVYYDLATPRAFFTQKDDIKQMIPHSKAYLPVRLFSESSNATTTDKIASLLKEEYQTSFDYISAIKRVTPNKIDPHTYLCIERTEDESVIYSAYMKPTLEEL